MLGWVKEVDLSGFGDKDENKLDFCLTLLWSVLKGSLWQRRHRDVHFIWEKVGWGTLMHECLRHIGWVMRWLNDHKKYRNDEVSQQRQEDSFQEANKSSKESTKKTVYIKLRWAIMQIMWIRWCDPTYGMGRGIGRVFSGCLCMIT